MFFKTLQFFVFFIFINLSLVKLVNAEILKEFEVIGNDRISTETIKIFSKVSINENLDEGTLNEILKNLYNTGFFKNINMSFKDNKLTLKVIENPIIESINYNGIKSSKILQALTDNSYIKERASFNKIELKNEKNRLDLVLNELGYYNSSVEIIVAEEKNNLINITKFNLCKI